VSTLDEILAQAKEKQQAQPSGAPVQEQVSPPKVETLRKDENVEFFGINKLLDEMCKLFPQKSRTELHQSAMNLIFKDPTLSLINALQVVRNELQSTLPPSQPETIQVELVPPAPEIPEAIKEAAFTLESMFPKVKEEPVPEISAGLSIELQEAAEPLEPTSALKIKVSPQLSGNAAAQIAPEKRVESYIASDSAGIIVTICSHKGEGKTTLAFAFKGKKAVLSFDNKSVKIKKYLYNDSSDILILNGIAIYDRSTPDRRLQSSSESVDLVYKMVKKDCREFEADWIIVDGLEVFSQMAEMKMRFNEGLRPYEGTPNRNVWKLRRDYIANLHELAVATAKKGVIYTTYLDKDEIIVDGTLVTKKDVPRWVDVVMEQTDIVIKTFMKQDQGVVRFFASVETSKVPFIKTGRVVDITDCYKPEIGLKTLIDPSSGW